MSVDESDEVTASVLLLERLGQDFHWFCERGDAEGRQQCYQEGRKLSDLESSVSNRLEVLMKALQIYAYLDANAGPKQEYVSEALDKQLARCSLCSIEYHRLQRRMLAHLRDEYEDDQVDGFAEIFQRMDLSRIKRGLSSIQQQKLPQGSETGQVKRWALHTLVEALANQPILYDEKFMTEYFDEPFRLLHRSSSLRVPITVPAMTSFLFDNEEVRQSWAKEQWMSLQQDLSLQAFDFAVKDPLIATLQLAMNPLPDSGFLERFWSGIAIIVDKLNSDLFTHSLRALDIDVCRLLLDHLQLDSGPIFAKLLQNLTLILKKAPTDFWEAMGSISPTTVLEQVFNNPQFDRLIQGSKDSPQAVGQSELLSWVAPLVVSLKSGQLSAVSRSLTFHLLERLQADRFPKAARNACLTQGLEVLLLVLTTLADRRTSIETVVRISALEALDITSAHLDMIVQECKAGSIGQARDIALNIAQRSLSLECKLLMSDRDNLQGLQGLSSSFTSYSPKIWSAVIPQVQHGNILLARACLAGMRDLTGLERFLLRKEKEYLREKEDFNNAFGSMTHQMCNLLERIADFEPKDLDSIFRSPDAATALVASLFSADSNTYEAGIDLIKTISGESGRREALRHLLQPFFETTMKGFSWAIHRIAARKTYAPCSRMLKSCTDAIAILCNVQDGLILDRTTLNQAQIEQINEFWDDLWSVLRMIYGTAEAWSQRTQDPANMKDFCRETMEFSEYVFDQYPVFTNAVGQVHQGQDSHQPITDGRFQQGSTYPKGLAKDLLRQPLSAMEVMVKWLRLRDEYLASISVKLITKLLGRQGDRELAIAEKATLFLEEVVVGLIRTVLSEQEKAQLAAALEDNALGNVPAIQAAQDTKMSTGGLSLDARRGEKGQAIRMRPATIDMRQWAENASRSLETAPGDIRKSYDQAVRSLTPAAEQFKRQQLAKDGSSRLSKQLEVVGRGQNQHPAQARRSAAQAQADQMSFRQRREEERLAKKQRDAEALARMKRNIPHLTAGQTSAEGSALKELGKVGKDHTPKGSGMMLSSESESDSEDTVDEHIFGDGSNIRLNGSVVGHYPSKSRQLHPTGPIRKQRQIRSAKDMRARLIPDLSTLHKVILSWDVFFHGDFPPSTARRDYIQVASSLRTPDIYRQTFEPLLLLEMWQDIRKGIEEGPSKPFEIKIANRLVVDSFVEVSTKMDAAGFKELELREADILLLSTAKAPVTATDQPHSLARVHKVNRKRESVEVSFRVDRNSKLLSQLTPSSMVTGLRITSITPPEREYGALLGLPYFDLCDEITRGIISPMLEFQPSRVDRISQNFTLNVAQSKAVLSAIENDGFSLIQGPPGSGKTKTIVAIVGALFTESFDQIRGVAVSGSAARDPQGLSKKVLICAHSNAAIDELVMRLKSGVRTLNGRQHSISIVRVGRGDKTNPNVLDVTLDELVERQMRSASAPKENSIDEIGKTMSDHKATCESLNAFRAVLEELQRRGEAATHDQKHELELLKRQKAQLSSRIDQLRDSGATHARDNEIARRRIRQDILDKAHVLCATLSGSGHDMFQSLKLDFETVIIDEAAQCTELSALIPLKYGCSKCIMVGDPKQLPPTIKSKAALDLQYAQSLFERMQSNQPKDVHLLDTQYRMHPEISNFPSRAFYDGKLVDGAALVKDRARPWHQNSLLGPYRFFNVAAAHQRNTRGHSLVNFEEINLAITLFQRLLSDAGSFDFTGKVSVITPYTAQFQQMKALFANRFGTSVLEKIEFNTTDAFQGRESEVVILSLVRGMGRGVGFLDDVRRMNVGLTRARSSLWVLGNSQTLSQDLTWSDLIEDAKRRHRFTDMSMAKLLENLNSGRGAAAAPISHAQDIKDIEMCYASDMSVSRRSSGDSGTSRSERSSLDLLRRESPTTRHSCEQVPKPSTIRSKCESFEHLPQNCNKEEVQNGEVESCFRCNQPGHLSSRCTLKRCFSCGEFGHNNADCTSSKKLSEQKKVALGQYEAKHRAIVQKEKEKHENRIMGMHGRDVPAVKSSRSSPEPPKSRQSTSDPIMPSKRKRERSPDSMDWVAERKSSRPNSESASSSRSPSLNRAPYGEAPLNFPLAQGQSASRPPISVRKKKEVDPFIRPKHQGRRR